MSHRIAAWLAWSLCVLSVALAAASLILSLFNGRTLAEIFLAWGSSTGGEGGLAALIVSFSAVGALIASHRPENLIGWIFLAVGFFYGLLSAGEQYAIYALLTNPGALPLGAEASWLMQWIWAPGLGLILVFLPLLFPNGHPPAGRWRWVAWLGGLSIGLICVLASIVLWPLICFIGADITYITVRTGRGNLFCCLQLALPSPIRRRDLHVVLERHSTLRTPASLLPPARHYFPSSPLGRGLERSLV
jgi:hypothetical protein